MLKGKTFDMSVHVLYLWSLVDIFIMDAVNVHHHRQEWLCTTIFIFYLSMVSSHISYPRQWLIAEQNCKDSSTFKTHFNRKLKERRLKYIVLNVCASGFATVRTLLLIALRFAPYFCSFLRWRHLFLFSLYMLPLSQITRKSQIAYHSYADDTQIYLALSPNDYSPIDSLCQCIDEINSWMCQNFLQLNKEKTEVIAFGNKDEVLKVNAYLDARGQKSEILGWFWRQTLVLVVMSKQ